METQNEPLVSIITINYNQLEMTCEMLDSLQQSSHTNFEVIVVDNHSKVNPKSSINKLFPKTKVIVSDKNLGFAGGNNLGIEVAKGDYFFFVNNDTELLPDTISTLLLLFDKVPRLGVVSPKICFFPADHEGKKDIIQYTGTTPINLFTARNRTLGRLEKDVGQYQKAEPTPYAHGAAMMVSKEVIEKVGNMPEMFFLYYEELDWCEQIKRAGFEVYVEPNATIYHKESLSIGSTSTLKTYYLTRNRILFMRRNYNTFQLIPFYLFLFFITIPKNVLVYLLNKQGKHLNAFLRGVWWNFSDTKDLQFH